MNKPKQPRLADGIGIARLGTAVVVLDITQDRYTRFEGRSAAVLCELATGTISDPDDPCVSALSARGIVTCEEPRASIWLDAADIVEPQASALDGPDFVVRPDVSQAAAAFSCLKARLDLRIRPLYRILEGLARRARGRPESTLLALARTFDKGRRLAPVAPRCLPDVLAFVRSARGRGHPVYLVFGVKSHPFEAHCWAQSGSLVLTDPLDRVRRFEPILAV